MRPLDPEERAEILARNPRATAEDVEAFEALLVERFELAAAEAPPVEGLAEEEGPARLQAVEAALDNLRARVLPNFDEAVAAVAALRVDADDAAAGDDGPPVG